MVICLDDLLLMHQDSHALMALTQETIELLTSLGFSVNFEKSRLSPTRSIEYLGIEIDSGSFKFRRPREATAEVQRIVTKTQNHGKRSVLAYRRLCVGGFVRAVRVGTLQIPSKAGAFDPRPLEWELRGGSGTDRGCTGGTELVVQRPGQGQRERYRRVGSRPRHLF